MKVELHDRVSIIYDNIGVMNGYHAAHITTYFGPELGSEIY